MRFASLFVVFCFAFCASAQPISEIFEPRSTDLEVLGRGKKGGKYLSYMLLAAFLIKSIVFPLAFKTMMFMSTISVIMSIMSFLISSVGGYYKPDATVKFHRRNTWEEDNKSQYGNYNTILNADRL